KTKRGGHERGGTENREKREEITERVHAARRLSDGTTAFDDPNGDDGSGDCQCRRIAAGHQAELDQRSRKRGAHSGRRRAPSIIRCVRGLSEGPRPPDGHGLGEVLCRTRRLVTRGSDARLLEPPCTQRCGSPQEASRACRSRTAKREAPTLPC